MYEPNCHYCDLGWVTKTSTYKVEDVYDHYEDCAHDLNGVDYIYKMTYIHTYECNRCPYSYTVEEILFRRVCKGEY